MNALYLGALGVPVGMVSGDDALADELKDWFPWAERVVVKRGISWQAADSVHPSRARELIREGAQRAVARIGGGDTTLVPLTMDGPLRLRIAFRIPVRPTSRPPSPASRASATAASRTNRTMRSRPTAHS